MIQFLIIYLQFFQTPLFDTFRLRQVLVWLLLDYYFNNLKLRYLMSTCKKVSNAMNDNAQSWHNIMTDSMQDWLAKILTRSLMVQQLQMGCASWSNCSPKSSGPESPRRPDAGWVACQWIGRDPDFSDCFAVPGPVAVCRPVVTQRPWHRGPVAGSVAYQWAMRMQPFGNTTMPYNLRNRLIWKSDTLGKSG